MKTKLLLFVCLSLLSASAAFACGGGCGSEDSCYGSTEGPCDCVDPACSDPYSCMSHGECCSAFGNIGAVDSSPAQDCDSDYSCTSCDQGYSCNSNEMLTAENGYQPYFKPAPSYHAVFRGYKGE